MIDQIVAFIVDEGKWLSVSMGLALLSATISLYIHSESHLRRRVLVAMNLFFGVTIGTMALGHLLAVTTKLAMGTLEGPVVLFYIIGIVLAIPSWWLILHTRRVLENEKNRKTLILNLWLAATLIVLGVHNLPLAAPAFFNIGYQLHTHRAMGWAILSIAVLVNLGLFVGSVIFMVSGQSFEQFSGME